MSRDVLVVMDRKPASDEALEHALAEHPDATVHVVHVTETNDPLDLFGTSDPGSYMVAECGVDLDDELLPDGNSFNRQQRKRAEGVLQRACTLADEHGRTIEPVVRSGDTVREVLECAQARDVDHLVVADGRELPLPPIVRTLPESVARNASRPVTIVG